MYRHLKIIIPLLILVVFLFAAVFGFSHFEGINLFDSLWMTVTTVMTIGYGDLIPETPTGRLLAIIIVPLCIVLFSYFMGLIISLLVEFKISSQKRSRQMEKKIKRLSRHIIICGLGTMTQTIIEKMVQEKRDFVIVEPDDEKTAPLIDKYLVVPGDPAEDDVLLRAGIEKAEGLITVRGDAENVLIILTARELNPSLIITSGAERVESEPKLRKAGADRVINPERIGGTRMALSVLKPAAVEYMDSVFTSDSENFRIEEVIIPEGAMLSGKTIKQAEIRSKYDVSVMAIKRHGKISTSDLADMQIEHHDILIVFGKDENLQNFRLITQSVQI